MFLKNLPIRHKLWSMLILPLLSMIILSGIIIFNRVHQVSESKELIQDSEFFAEIGATVHNLQKERGTSVAFVSSNGTKMADKLPALRATSDNSIQILSNSINTRVTHSNYPIQNTLEILTKLQDLRKKATELQIDGLVCAAQYTNIIQSLLELTNIVAKATHNAEIMRGANTYSAYLNMKERAGRERAILAGIFAIDKMDLPYLLKLAENLGEYNASFSQFMQSATDTFFLTFVNCIP